MTIETTDPVFAEKTITERVQSITAAPGGAGVQITHTAATSLVVLRNIGSAKWDVEYRVGTGEWLALGPLKSVSLAINLATTALRVRRGENSPASTDVLLTLEGVPGSLLVGDPGIAPPAPVPGDGLLRSAFRDRYMAHRGGWYINHENTIAAFDAAYKAGFRFMECDLRLTSDGHIVLLHDATVDRTMSGTGAISSLTLAQFKAMTVDALTTYSPAMAAGVPATLEELLDWAIDKDVVLVGETVVNCSAQLLAHLQLRNFPVEKFWPQTSTPSWNAALHSAGYRGVYLTSAITTGQITEAGLLGFRAIHTERTLWTAPLVASAKAAGLECWAYTVYRNFQAAALLALGVDRITSPDPIYMARQELSQRLTFDGLAANRWQPGMCSPTTAGAEDQRRGEFPGGGVLRLPNLSGYTGTTLGYACPAPSPTTHTISGKMTLRAADNDGSYFGVFICGPNDQEYINDAANSPTGYHVLFRKNGTVQIFRRDGVASGVSIVSQAGTALAIDTEYDWSITVTPTSVSATCNAITATVDSATHRGGYVQVGRTGSAVDLRQILIA